MIGRKMKGRALQLLALVLAFMFLVTGCGGSTTKKRLEGIPTHTVVDCADRTVEVPDDVRSIACLYAYAGHACVFLECEDRITAIVNGLKRDVLMERKVEGLQDMPTPYQDQAINIEELMAVNPDIVLLRTENLSNEGEVKKLDKTGVPYVVIDYTTMEEQLRSISVIGEALSCEEEAQAYLTYYEDTMNMVRERTGAIPEEEKKTVYHSVNEVVRTDVKDTLSYEVLEAAGLINVIDIDDSVSMEGIKAYATVEQIYVWDPDVVLANEAQALEYFKTDSKFEGLRAVREGQVYQLPIGLSRWAHPGSIESPLAALYVAKLIYPEYFEDIDIDQEVKDFYHNFVRIDLTDEELAEIYSGIGMRTEKVGSGNDD